MAHRGAVVTREILLKRVWGTESAEPLAVEKRFNTLTTHIHYLRRKLEKNPIHAPCILTVDTIGYRFNQ